MAISFGAFPHHFVGTTSLISDYVQVGLLLLDKTVFYTRQQGNVKSLMKTLKLHIIVIEPSIHIFNHHK